MAVTPQDLLLARAAHWEATKPNKVFLTQPHSGGQTTDYTWRQTMDEARRMATHLIGLGLPKPSQIAIVGKNSAHWMIADLAIWMAGHVSVPLYPTMTTEHVRQVLQHSESKLLFVGKLDDWPMIKAGVPADMPLIELPLAPATGAPKWERIVAEAEPLAELPQRDPKEMATIIYTSGTTGTPKGVMLSFEGMVAAMTQGATDIEVKENDRYISYLPLAHTYERYAGEGLGIYHGLHLYFAETMDSFVADLQRARPTFFCSVPRLWVKFQAGVHAKVPPEKLQKLLSIPIVSWLVKRKVLKGLGLDKVRVAFSGAAPLPPDVLEWYRRLGLPLLEGYGMTENHSYSHASTPDANRTGYVGKARPGVETRISEQGEILVRSPTTMMGYYKAPEVTADVLTADGFLRTGDLGEIDGNGMLRITGRVKDIFKTAKGKYVSPTLIENRLISSPLLDQACVCGAGYAQPFALVMLAEEMQGRIKDPAFRGSTQASLEKLLNDINADLESHERLQFLAVVDGEWQAENGMVTPTMKIRRAVIEQHYSKHFKSWFDAQQPVLWEAA
ncbi:MAG TPA: AMP-binding protein [bacterium]|nr:AMP-binding protein [bacterium]